MENPEYADELLKSDDNVELLLGLWQKGREDISAAINAIEEIFDVEVKKVNIMNIKGKLKRMGRTAGYTAASKKAIVTLTADSKEIEFFQSL